MRSRHWANMKHAFEWRFAEARELTDRVLAIEPNHVRALAEGSIMPGPGCSAARSHRGCRPRAIATNRENFTANWSRVIALAAAGHDDDALNAAEDAFVIFKQHPSILAAIAAVHARRGNVFTAEAIFHELRERAKTTFVSRAVRAAVAASAGLTDDARQLLGEAIAERDAFLTFYKLPACRALRADAECTTMLNEMVYIKDALH